MKKISFFIIVLFTFSASLFAQKEEYQKFEEASKLKQREKALEWISRAYQKAPTKDKYRYWYARELHRHQKYREALDVRKSLHLPQRSHCPPNSNP